MADQMNGTSQIPKKPESRVRADVVQLLEEALTMAKSGSVQGVSIVIATGPEAFGTHHAGKHLSTLATGGLMLIDQLKMAIAGPPVAHRPRLVTPHMS